jgi:hypothetical protein
MRRNVNIPGLEGYRIHTALEYAKQLHFLKVLLLLIASLDFINQLHPRKLINGVNFEQVGTNSTVLLGPKLGQSENIFTVMVLIPAGKFFEAIVILFAIGEALLF